MRFYQYLLLISIAIGVLLPPQAQAQLGLLTGSSENNDGQAAEQQANQKDLEELIRLLSNPELVKQLQQRLPATDSVDNSELSVSALETYLQASLVRIQLRATEIVHALAGVPQLSQALSAAWVENMAGGNFLRSAIYVIIFLFGGFGLEWLFWSYFSGTLKRTELSKPKSYGQVLKLAALRVLLLFGGTAVFVLGSIGLFVSFEWSVFIGNIVLSLLAGIISLRFIVMISIFVLAPRVDDLRLMPLDKPAARNIYRWILAVSSTGVIGFLIVDTLNRMGVDSLSILALEVVTGLVFISVLIVALWQITAHRHKSGHVLGIEPDREVETILPQPRNFIFVLWSTVILTAYLLWLLEVDTVMWTLVILSFLFPAISLSRVMVDHIFDTSEGHTPTRALESLDNQESEDEAQLSTPGSRYELYRPIVIRMIRFLLVVIALVTLGGVWDVASMMQSATGSLSSKIFGIFIDVVFALLIGELLWTWAKTAIDQKLSTIEITEPGLPTGPEARLATLLPMIRKVLLATIIVMVSLILLSSLGINIGPILAGAGVLGIALGFGAQALVKDIVSGIFFLIEDAFRVGEYIEVGSLRGTVESVSVRSLRVRHHRGAVHTIPFGELSSLTNHSRDWAIMKLEFRVPFDTDIKLIKKIIKKVSVRLQENEDYGHFIIEPLKSQGVRRMEEFNMVVGVKFMAVPGQQWTIRRDAYQQIRDAFKENGIEFAQRNVTVEVVSDRALSKEEEEAAVSAAQDTIEAQATPKATPDEP
jgi:small-conductance mechanosensitive channel